MMSSMQLTYMRCSDYPKGVREGWGYRDDELDVGRKEAFTAFGVPW